MTIIGHIERVVARLRQIPDLVVRDEGRTAPAGYDAVVDLERVTGHPLPDALRRFFLHEAGGVRFGWDAPRETFGAECSGGYLYLLTPGEIADSVRDMRGIVTDLRAERDLAVDAGAAAAVRDWPHWIPLCRFPAGDAFCLDTRHGEDDYPVVFLKHDVVGDEPVVHGLRIAASFDDLLTRWGRLGFVDLWDWTAGVAPDGIDPDAPIFRRLRDFLRE